MVKVGGSWLITKQRSSRRVKLGNVQYSVWGGQKKDELWQEATRLGKLVQEGEGSNQNKELK